LPITLDTVLRLAERSNPRIALAREKLHESLICQEKSCRDWLPQTYAGISYYRHEGGIQNEDGTLTHSSTQALMPALQLQSELDRREAVFRRVNTERMVWQQKAELSQVNNEVLLEAANTYIDLLTARRGEAVARELDRDERRLFRRVEALAKEEAAAQPLRETIRAALAGREAALAKLAQQAKAASAKLVYLLGLPPETNLVPSDYVLAPIDLVDVTPPASELVARAWAGGPGVQELEGLLRVIQSGIEEGEANKLAPALLLNVSEGPFGAGVGSSLTWDNRLDVGIALRWNLSQLTQADRLRRVARSKQEQVVWTLQDVRGKLALGVTEGREAVRHGRQQIGLVTTQIKHASESYRLSNRRFEEGIEGASPAEVVLAIRALEQAHLTHLQAISAHNKAQVRLLLLLGAPSHGPAAGAPAACQP
jgi:outer membrane protein TolC